MYVFHSGGGWTCRLLLLLNEAELLSLSRLPRVLERLHVCKVSNKLTILWGG